jgi:hypothetical protein
MFISGWIVGYIVIIVALWMGISYIFKEQEEMKDIQTESDLFNFRKKK